ncbi:MAG: phage tail sheath family protein, partial [Thioalkalivibrio sp.]|nr:phage tail sheath family protein [Thioalkalivibrio sp.]
VDDTDAALFNITVNEVVDGGIRASEVFRDLSISPDSPRFVTALEQQSGLVRVSGPVPDDRPALSTVTDGVPAPATRGQQGGDGVAVGFDQIAHPDLAGSSLGIWALDHADIFNLLCIPPFTRLVDVTEETWTAALTYCRTRRAMLIVDPPSGWTTPDNVLDGTIGIDGTGSAVPARDANASVYFPRVRMADPLEENRLETFAPCGVIAGIHSRTDAQRGVWKAPAGVDATLIGVRELAYHLTDGENGRLNPLAVNALRTFPVTGNVVWGARTMRGADQLASEWKYIPVRRLALHLEESLYRGTQWVVFEPNDEALWAQIRLNVGAFMHDLFRQGALQGTTPRDAYFVKCDAETTTQNDIDQGIVNFSVGFAPLKPAEFIIIRIRQMAGNIQT